MELRISESSDCISLKFRIPVGCLSELTEQLAGRSTTIYPSLCFQIDFETLGPRLGVYLRGVHYGEITIGTIGPEFDPDDILRGTYVPLSLEVGDEEIIELHHLFEEAGQHSHPYWSTTIPKKEVEPFTEQVQQNKKRVFKQIRSQSRIPNHFRCPYCGEDHKRHELFEDTDINPRKPVQNIEESIRCPNNRRRYHI